MILNSPYITGSITVTGNANVQGTLTVTGSLSGTATSASLASNSNLLQGTGSVGFSTTASLLEVSSSQQQISASLLNVIANYATTGSNSFRANQSITGSLVVSSTITAQTLVVQTVTSSIVYSSGSNIFGSALGDRQTFTGSILTSGNVGLGITPSAWNGIYRVFQIDAGSISSSPSYNNISVGANVFYNAGNSPRYIVSDYATLYGQDDGLHAWYTAPSGTAGAAMTFTQSMTLTAAGNLGVGTSTPTDSIIGASLTMLDITGASGGALKLHHSTTTYGEFSFYKGTNGSFIDSAGASTVANNDLIFRTGRTGSNYTVLEAMRVASTGNVGIGTSPSTSLMIRPINASTNAFSILDPSGTAQRIAGISFSNVTNAGELSLDSNGTTNVRISANRDSYISGSSVLIGTTSNSTGNPTFYIQNKAGLVANIAGFNFSSTSTAENANNNILASGAYYNGAATTATQTSATLYQQSSGAHTFYTNNGLTAGNNYTATERMIITNAGLVGIGTTSPTHNLEIANAAGSVYQKLNADFGIGYFGMETADDSMRFVTAQSTPIQFYTNNGERMRITPAGDICAIRNVSGIVGSYRNLSFGAAGLMARDAYDSYFVGNLYYDSAGWKLKYGSFYGNCVNWYDGQYSFQTSATNGAVDSTVALTSTLFLDRSGNAVFKGSVTQNGSPSDINLKQNLVKITSPLEKISQINGYNFDWKEGTAANGLVISVAEGMQAPESPLSIAHDAGLIAQEVEAVMPQLVRDNGHKALNYNGIIALLVEGIKELKVTNDDLQAQINELKER